LVKAPLTSFCLAFVLLFEVIVSRDALIIIAREIYVWIDVLAKALAV
jgi:hypothetical protein